MRPYTRKTKCDHIFPSAAALAVTCDHISPERRQRRDPRRRGALAAPQCGAIRAAVGPAGKKPPQAGEGTPRITRARTLGASAVRVGAPPSRRSVRLPIAEKLKEPQRTPKGAAPRPFGAYDRIQYRARRADRPSPSRLRRPPGAWRNRPRLGLPRRRDSRGQRVIPMRPSPKSLTRRPINSAAAPHGRTAAASLEQNDPGATNSPEIGSRATGSAPDRTSQVSDRLAALA